MKPFATLVSMVRMGLAAGLLMAAFAAPAHAYLDGGTGSMILQVILAGVGGIAIAARLFWRRLFGRPPSEETKTPSDEPRPRV